MVSKVVKKRRITRKDMEGVASFIKDEKARRKGNKFRTEHEKIWKEVDRQIAMKPKSPASNDPQENWESNLELGSLSDASEIITADVMRILFPSDRDFFRPHMDIPKETDPETGLPAVDPKKQKMADGIYRSLMMQQLRDFGFRHRVKLSVKEALSHGSFVAVCRWETQKQFSGGRTRTISAPTWVPYSMWNCYPDDSPTVIGTNITYDGSMIIEEEIPLSTAMQQKWMNLDKLHTKATKDRKDHITILHWYGDVFIKRSGEGLLVPNQHVITNEDMFLFAEQNDSAYPPIIYSGYERDNVLDPYYSSPLIKRSPSQKIATHCANKYLDAIDLGTFPPLGYDANEPAFAEKGGPVIAPNETFALRAGGQIKTIEVVEPSHALQGLQIFKQETEEGTGVDVARKGTSASVEQTAFEVSKLDQKSEIRTVDFVGSMESQGIGPYLYMHHDLNTKKMTTYSFFNSQLDTPDFMTISREEVVKFAKNGHFEVVGSKGVLGEEKRRQGSLEVTAFFASNPLFAPKLDTDEIMNDAYRDVGVKDPERYIIPQDNPEIAALTQQFEQQMQQIQEELIECKKIADVMPIIKAEFKADLSAKESQLISMRAENKMLEEQIQLAQKADAREKQLFAAEKRLLTLKDQIGDMLIKLKAEGVKGSVESAKGEAKDAAGTLAEKESEVNDLLKVIDEDRQDREETKAKVIDFIKARGSTEAQELVDEL